MQEKDEEFREQALRKSGAKRACVWVTVGGILPAVVLPFLPYSNPGSTGWVVYLFCVGLAFYSSVFA